MKSHKKCEHVANFTVEERLIVVWSYLHNTAKAIDELNENYPQQEFLDDLFKGIKGCREALRDIIERHLQEICKDCAHSNATFEEILDCYKKGKDKKMPHGHKTVEA